MNIIKAWFAKAHHQERVADVTTSLNDLSARGACRTAESAGNGMLPSGEKNFSVHKTYMNFSKPRKRAPEAALYSLRGSLLPENGTDATPLLGDVYNNSTRARKRLADVSLCDSRALLPQNVPDTTLPDDDVYNLGTRRGRMQVDRALSQKSLLPENGTNATPFSSDVYNKGTRAKKRLAGVSLYGRSMVEMLGVLAIIGVLSVGAISGYQKAMTKYRLNKMTEQYNTIINYISSTKAQWLHKEMGDTYVELFPILKKMNVIPNEMDKDQSSFLYDILGNPSYLRQRTDYLEFAVYLNAQNGEKFYSNLSQLETCRALFQYVLIPNHAEVDRIAQYIGSGDTSHAALEYYGDSRDCEKSKSCLRSMTLSDVENACHFCDEDNLCRILAIWR